MSDESVRLKDLALAEQLQKEYPGSYKLFSDAGWGDCSIVEREMTIVEAIQKMGSMLGWKTDSISTIMGIDHDSGKFNEDCLSQARYRIVPEDQIMECEEEGFDWMDS